MIKELIKNRMLSFGLTLIGTSTNNNNIKINKIFSIPIFLRISNM